MVEGAISALHQFARDPTSAALILHRPVVMNLLVDVNNFIFSNLYKKYF